MEMQWQQSIQQANINPEDIKFFESGGPPCELNTRSVEVTHIKTKKSKNYFFGCFQYSEKNPNMAELMIDKWLPEFIKDYNKGCFTDTVNR